VLGYSRQDMDRKAIGLREIDGHELDPCFHECGDEGHVPSKAIELRDDQRRFVQTTGSEGSNELRAIRFFPGLDFREFLQESP
jgi:hypothetical protein